jgi:uncharacterized UPF0160 family protein
MLPYCKSVVFSTPLVFKGKYLVNNNPPFYIFYWYSIYMQVVVTHNGSFDPDDVLAVAIVTMYLGKGNYEVVRSRDYEVIDKADWVIDVGGKYDASTKRFDHHQNGVPKRDNKVPYSAFGLVWDDIGEEVCGSASVAKALEEKLVYAIDAADNAVEVCCTCGLDIQSYEFFDVINTFKPVWGSEEDFYTGFMRAVSFARKLLRRQIAHQKGEEAMISYAKEIYDKAADKQFLELEKPVVRHSSSKLEETKMYISPVFATDSPNWMAVAVPHGIQSFASRTSFPEAWRGLSDSELEEVSGIEGAIFCHKEGYMFVANSKDAALTAAQKALSL